MEQVIIGGFVSLFLTLLAWLGNRFVKQIDKLTESVTGLATSVAALQESQKAIWKRIDSLSGHMGRND